MSQVTHDSTAVLIAVLQGLERRTGHLEPLEFAYSCGSDLIVVLVPWVRQAMLDLWYCQGY